MKKLASLALLILLFSATKSYAQNLPGETSPVDKSKVIKNLLDRIDASEELLKAQEDREKKLVEEIAKADAAQKELTDAHKLALLELGDTRATIRHLKSEIEGYKQQVDLWKNEAGRLKSELKSSRKRELILLGALILRSIL